MLQRCLAAATPEPEPIIQLTVCLSNITVSFMFEPGPKTRHAAVAPLSAACLAKHHNKASWINPLTSQ
jgi:hypothetical protein